jgi:type IV pilus assembly protein PilV
MRKQQSGSVILESMIAILIFSMGILAIVGLQAAAISASSDAKYRTIANLLANQLVGQMWVSNRTSATLQSQFQTGGTKYNLWLADVQAALPGVAAPNNPTVTILPVAGLSSTSSKVTITVFWKTPSEPAADPPHQYVTVVQII